MSSFTLTKVLVTDSIDKCCKEILEKNGVAVDQNDKISKEELIKIIPNFDGLIVRSVTKVTSDIIEAGTNLKVIGRAGTGVDNIDCDAATKKSIYVMNTPGGNTVSAAEHTCAMIVCMARRLPQAHQSMKEGRWDRKVYSGHEIYGKTLGIIGLGRIGKEVALRMQAFGMKTIGYDPIIPASVSAEFNTEWMELDKMWPLCDYITVHVPLIKQTKGLIGSESLPKCKPGVKVVNVARGGVIDEVALLAALKSGQCGGAGLDVFEEEPPKCRELIEHPLVVATPHLGASTAEAQTRCASDIAQQFIDLATGAKIFGVVNKF